MAKDKQTQSTDLELKGPSGNLPAAFQEEIAKDLATDLNSGGFELPRIETVHQGQVFNMPGEPDPVRRIKAVLLGTHRFNVYWQKRGENDGGNVPPDCVARDAVTAGRPAEMYKATDPKSGEVIETTVYGKCGSCWFNQFGSSTTGGKACANKAHLLIWPVGIDAIVPYLMTCSGTSLVSVPGRPLGMARAESEIRAQMAVHQAPQLGLVAEFYLEKKQNGQQVWSVLHANVVGSVRDGAMSVEDYRRVSVFAAQYLPQLSDAPVNADEMQDAEVVQPPPANDDCYPPDKFEAAKARATQL